MSYWRLFYHFVWTTKHREPLIGQDFQSALFDAIGAKVIELGGIAHAVGGVPDHVHLVASVPPTVAVATFVGQVKGNSSHFVNHEIRPSHAFAWQDGYGVVSSGERHLGWVVRYAHSQAERHGAGRVIEWLEQTTRVEGVESDRQKALPSSSCTRRTNRARSAARRPPSSRIWAAASTPAQDARGFRWIGRR